MKRLMIGRAGELVVSVHVTSISPSGSPEVSNFTFTEPFVPGLTGAAGIAEACALSTSILYIFRSDAPALLNTNSASTTVPAFILPAENVLVVNMGLGPDLRS